MGYHMCPIIYDLNFRVDRETTHAWDGSRSNLFPTYFIKESLFILSFAVGKSLHFDMDTINKIRPSCTRVKVQIDLPSNFEWSVRMEIKDENTRVFMNIFLSIVLNINYKVISLLIFECCIQS